MEHVSNNAGILVFLVGAAFVCARAIFARSSISQSGFSQKGFGVNWDQGTVTLDHHKFPASAVRRVAWRQQGYGGVVTIDIDDMRRPQRSLKFRDAKQAEEFYCRFSLAMAKAGYPLSMVR